MRFNETYNKIVSEEHDPEWTSENDNFSPSQPINTFEDIKNAFANFRPAVGTNISHFELEFNKFLLNEFKRGNVDINAILEYLQVTQTDVGDALAQSDI